MGHSYYINLLYSKQLCVHSPKCLQQCSNPEKSEKLTQSNVSSDCTERVKKEGDDCSECFVCTLWLILFSEIHWRAKARTESPESPLTWSSSPRCLFLLPKAWSILELSYSDHVFDVLNSINYSCVIFFLQTPLTESLIEFTDTAMNRVAADLFLCKFSPSLISPLITSSHYISLITSGLRFTLRQNDMFLYQILNTQVLNYSTKSDI